MVIENLFQGEDSMNEIEVNAPAFPHPPQQSEVRTESDAFLSEAAMSEDECLKLLASDGMLVKRPLLIGYGFVLVGFRQDEWDGRLLAM